MDGILSFQVADGSRPKATKVVNGDAESDKVQEAQKTQLARRGASQAFNQLSVKFGANLLEVVPSMWQSMAGGLLSACQVGMCVFTLHRPEGHH